MEYRSDRFKNIEDMADNSDSTKFSGGNCLKILFLVDLDHEALVVQNHFKSIVKYSKHRILCINPIKSNIGDLPLVSFDLVLLHYSILILSEYFFPFAWRKFLKGLRAPIVQIIQDEHRSVNEMIQAMVEFDVRSVISSLSKENAKKVYGCDDLKGVSFYCSLPGYFCESLLAINPSKIKDRLYDIVYRGRNLPFKLGRFAQDKERIGRHVKVEAERAGLKIDICWREEDRIYGSAWYDFLASGRSCLAVEGGASIFDFDGNLEKSIAELDPGVDKNDFEQVWNLVLKKYEGNVLHKTITPRIFEAISLKTALVMYPGEYRDILVPGRHYIELYPDNSNIDDVFNLIRDTDYLQNLVDLTFKEVAKNPTLQYSFYVKCLDAIVSDTFNRNELYRNLRYKISKNLYSTMYIILFRIYIALNTMRVSSLFYKLRYIFRKYKKF